MELFIKSTDELKEHSKNLIALETGGSIDTSKETLEKIPEEAMDTTYDNDEDLAPLAVARSVSMPLTPG